jgi:ATP-dependent DNA helicase RecG
MLSCKYFICDCVLRGIKVKSTLGFLEVVVGCSIVESELSSSVEGSHSGAEQKRIHLHLKKFFSGTRFSSQYFLNCMSAKHKEGDLVYVSGKVGVLKYCDLSHATC